MKQSTRWRCSSALKAACAHLCRQRLHFLCAAALEGILFSTMLIDSGYLWVGPVTISTLLSIFTPIGVVPLYITIELLDLVKMFVAFWFLKRGRWVRNLAAD